MISMTLADAAKRIGASYLGDDCCFSSVSTDSRSLTPGSLFVALTGPRFDGHDYLDSARAQGAVAAMVSRPIESPLPTMLVEDTRLALGRLASVWRLQSEATLVAITGSNGKTTVKEMIAAILAQRGEVLATEGNLNNDIGVPLTLLRMQQHDFAVVEMGANHPGEIGYLSRLARPDLALLINAGRAHLEGFGSPEGVARAKGEIVSGLGPDGLFIFNADSPWATMWQELSAGRPVRTFGLSPEADFHSPAQEYRLDWLDGGFVTRFPLHTPNGNQELRLSLAGRHNRMNALAAAAAAEAMGADLRQIALGLASLTPVKGRLQPLQGSNGISLIDDSYNANPDSVGAAIEVLASAPGRRFLVLGELAELGDGVGRFYREIGSLAADQGIEHLYTIGDAGEAASSFGTGGAVFENREGLIAALRKEVKPGDRVLAKGSRMAGMEQVIEAFCGPEVM